MNQEMRMGRKIGRRDKKGMDGRKRRWERKGEEEEMRRGENRR